jgi:hypothetical protein
LVAFAIAAPTMTLDVGSNLPFEEASKKATGRSNAETRARG